MHNVSGDAHTFSDATVGYSAQTPLTATITNIGNSSLTGGIIVLTDGLSFALSKTMLDAMASGSIDTFTVIPKTGLTAGVYSDTVTVIGTPGSQTASFTVSFTVSAAPLNFDTPTFSGTLKVGEAIIDGKLSIPYTNATGGESYDITVAVAGSGAVGIDPVTTAVTKNLTQGNGIIEIPITGTPTTAGQVTFTISGIAKLTSNMVTVNVSPFAGGDGTSGNPYQIDSAAGLAAMANNLTAHYILTDDIDLSAYGNWTPIAPDDNYPFTGSFDGVYTIDGLTIESGSYGSAYAGLFGYIGTSGRVKNLTLTNVSIDVTYAGIIYAGGVAGYNYGTITNCDVTGSVSTTGGKYVYASGIAGRNSGTITNCYVTGDMTSTADGTDGFAYAGGVAGYNGIIGYNGGTITSCYTTGVVTAIAGHSAYAGGIAGVNNGSGSITKCYAMGTVTAASTRGNTYAGGAAGYNGATITNSYATGDVTSTSDGASGFAYAGGVAGVNYSSVTSCYATGDVTSNTGGTNSIARAGGVVGYNNTGTITNCYATGDVTATATSSFVYAGGVAGYNEESGSITNCVALGSSVRATGSTVRVARVVGYNSATITRCYANSGMVLIDITVGDSENNGTGVGSNVISIQSWWTNSSNWSTVWDFTNVWYWDSGHLPYLNAGHKILISNLGMKATRMLLPQTATLTLGTSGNGAASHDGEYGDTFLIGTEVTITATPDAGYVFAEWQDENGETVSTDAVYSFEIKEDMMLTAVFTLAEETQAQGDTPSDTPDSEDEPEQQDADSGGGDNTPAIPETEPTILPQDEDEPEDARDDTDDGDYAPEDNGGDGSEAIKE